MDDGDLIPAKKPVHEIGCELGMLSVEELEMRVGLLKEEIARLEAAIAAKKSSRAAADSVFKTGISRETANPLLNINES